MESGVPDGVVNILPGFGETAGDALVRHRGVDKIAFTGSTDVGRKIISNGGIKRVSLELGGKNPLIVLNDANLDTAVMFAHLAAFVNSGQACLSGSRTFVQEGVYDEFVKRSAEMAKGKKVGDPFEEGSENGP